MDRYPNGCHCHSSQVEGAIYGFKLKLNQDGWKALLCPQRSSNNPTDKYYYWACMLTNKKQKKNYHKVKRMTMPAYFSIQILILS